VIRDAPLRPRWPLWKWSLVVTAAACLLVAWHCGSALVRGKHLDAAAVLQFHQRLNAEQYEVIWNDADQRFKDSGPHDQMQKFFQAVHTKLGDAGSVNLGSIRLNATTNGTFIITQHNTTFTHASGTETFTWLLQNSSLKLVGYNIQSNALITN